MKEDLISLETAKLAKEKGFHIRCETFYNEGSRYKLQSDSILRTGSDEIIEAPTQALLQKWLREKHQIDIVVEVYSNGITREYLAWILYRPWESDLENETPEDDNYCLTYEQALEEGLKEALKLI